MRDNILFQAPNRALLFQNARLALDTNFAEPRNLVRAVNAFLDYTQSIHPQGDDPVGDSQKWVTDLGRGLQPTIAAKGRASPEFAATFTNSAALFHRPTRNAKWNCHLAKTRTYFAPMNLNAEELKPVTAASCQVISGKTHWKESVVSAASTIK